MIETLKHFKSYVNLALCSLIRKSKKIPILFLCKPKEVDSTMIGDNNVARAGGFFNTPGGITVGIILGVGVLAAVGAGTGIIFKGKKDGQEME